MARSFDVQTRSRAAVEQIHAAFGDERYWLARLEVYGGDTIALNSLSVASDGTIEVATTQDLSRDVLPTFIAKALPRGFVLLRNEIWRRADDRLSGEVTIDASGVNGSILGLVDIGPGPGGTQMSFTGSINVKVPLIGGQIEKYIAGEVVKEIPDVSVFTDEWISANG